VWQHSENNNFGSKAKNNYWQGKRATAKVVFSLKCWFAENYCFVVAIQSKTY
jgi:hypothetical protein